jgi:hypothetical protein
MDVRDGIFKSLSMGLRWRTFMECCNRPADHGERVREQAVAAISGDIDNELPPPFRAAITAFVNEAQQSLPGVGSTLPEWDDGTSCTALERSVRTQFDRVADAGMSSPAHAKTAVELALVEWCDQRLRQVEQQVKTEDLKTARSALAVAREAVMSAAPLLATELLSGTRTKKRRSPARPSLDLDEDLRARH